MDIQIVNNQVNQEAENLSINNKEDSINTEENFDINNFKQVIRNQNLTLLSVNIKDLQSILNIYLNSLEQLSNNEEYLINLFKL